MDAAKADGRSSRSRERTNFVAAQRISGLSADADDIAKLNRPQIKRLECLISNLWVPSEVGAAGANTSGHRVEMTPIPNDQ
jgi:hypothetical protein